MYSLCRAPQPRPCATSAALISPSPRPAGGYSPADASALPETLPDVVTKAFLASNASYQNEPFTGCSSASAPSEACSQVRAAAAACCELSAVVQCALPGRGGWGHVAALG